MKTIIKIILLLIISIGVITGILYFAKTRVAPPSSPEQIDQYSARLSSCVSALDSISDFADCRTAFFSLNDKIDRFYLEGMIDASTADNFKIRITENFGQRFVANSFALFSSSMWSPVRLEEVSEDLAVMSGMQLQSGQPASSTTLQSSYGQIQAVLERYNSALRLTRQTTFRGLSDARQKMNLARSYSNSDYLRNNTELVAALNRVPLQLAQAHYNYLATQSERLNGYYSMSKEDYMRLVSDIDQKFREYRDTNIYGNAKTNLASLNSSNEARITSALNYYSRF